MLVMRSKTILNTPLAQPCRPLAQQWHLEALALPGLERQNDPQEQHRQNSQDPKQKQNHWGRDGRKDNRGDGQPDKRSPEQNALPGMKADETVIAMCRQNQKHRRREKSEVSESRGSPFRGRKRSHRPSACRTEGRVRRHHGSTMRTLHRSLR